MRTKYSIIRKSRLTLTKHNHRFVGVRKGQIVYYWFGKRLKDYKVIGIEDCYDWSASKHKWPRHTFSRYIELEPVKPDALPPKLSQHLNKNIMDYNNKIWKAGYIGHSVSYDEIFLSVGEALHACM